MNVGHGAAKAFLPSPVASPSELHASEIRETDRKNFKSKMV